MSGPVTETPHFIHPKSMKTTRLYTYFKNQAKTKNSIYGSLLPTYTEKPLPPTFPIPTGT